jgi:hypothetical protein
VDNNDSAYRTEHTLAWLMAAVAAVLGAIGALEAFDIINLGNAHLTPDGDTNARGDAGIFVDGALLLLPGIIAAFLAFTLHRNEHHEHAHSRNLDNRNNIPTTGTDRKARGREEDLWKAEHAGAYAAAFASIAFAVIGIIVGFHALDEAHTFYDGLTWLFLSLLSSILAATLHSVGHHLPEVADDHIRTIVAEHVSRPSATVAEGQTRSGTIR